jgi:uncharacterized damage-inducible protein DinB
MCGGSSGRWVMLGGMSATDRPSPGHGERQISDSAADLPTRKFGWSDMFLAQEDDPRFGDPPELAGERATLVDYLRHYRLTLQLKCTDLDADAMAMRSVPPSNLSLLGLVRHMADVERYWFREVMAGQDAPRHYPRDDDHNEFDGAVGDPAVVQQAWDNWRAEVAFAEQFVDEAKDLDIHGSYDQGPENRGTIELREVILHMIEEYARHCGHADFLRERIDGRVGQ